MFVGWTDCLSKAVQCSDLKYELLALEKNNTTHLSLNMLKMKMEMKEKSLEICNSKHFHQVQGHDYWLRQTLKA